MQARIGNVEESHADPVAEARRLLEAARAFPVTIRLVGGVGIRLKCPSAGRPPLERPYKDLDFVGRSTESSTLQGFFVARGYTASRRFNALNGHRRLLFDDEARSRQVDILLDTFEMCHRIDIRDRLDLDAETLPVADLLVTKLQVVEANQKDLLDCLALLADHSVTEGPEGIDGGYVARLCARDWGLYRTLQMNREKVEEYAARLEGPIRGVVLSRLAELYERIEREPKGIAWKLRAKVGDRVKWYELPEEVG
jgi:hypothetical protein